MFYVGPLVAICAVNEPSFYELHALLIALLVATRIMGEASWSFLVQRKFFHAFLLQVCTHECKHACLHACIHTCRHACTRAIAYEVARGARCEAK